MRLLALVSALAVQGFVRASQDYPKVVKLERTESEVFVSKPNVLNGVSFGSVRIVAANPNKREIHLYTERENGNQTLDCFNDRFNDQPQLEVIRPDLPGSFVCGGKTMYVIPVIHVQLDRFFNVSLDFLRVRGTGGSMKFNRASNMPSGLMFEFAPSGIVFVSGIIRDAAPGASLVPGLAFRSEEGNILYKIKIMLLVEGSAWKPKETTVSIDMVSKRDDSNLPVVQKQIKAIKCAASALSLNPWDLYKINPEKEFVEKRQLRASFEFTESSCVPGPKQSNRCDDFSIIRIYSKYPRCEFDAKSENTVTEPQTQETTETPGSEENSNGTVSEVRIENSQIVTSAPMSTSSTTAMSTSSTTATSTSSTTATSTSSTTPTTSVLPEQDADVSEGPQSVDTESDSEASEVRSTSIPPTLLQNEVSNRTLDDPKLKTALYGVLALVATVITIIFLFLFSKLELCKKKAGYDPVFMARLSDENGKFP